MKKGRAMRPFFFGLLVLASSLASQLPQMLTLLWELACQR